MSMEPSPVQLTFSHWPAMEYVREGGRHGQLILLEAANFLGYVPQISPIVGVARIIFTVALLNDGNDAKLRAPFIARRLAEIFSLGIYLVPIDLVNTYLLAENGACDPESSLI